MNVRSQRRPVWSTLPLVGFIVSEWRAWDVEQRKPCFGFVPMPQDASRLPPYPVDLGPLLDLPHGPVDENGVLYVLGDEYFPGGYYATAISQYALACWNAYLKTLDEEHKKSFLIQAEWLVAHEVPLPGDAGGWPFTVPLPDYHAESPWLSALTQGNSISVLVRAYRLTGKDIFLQVAQRAVRSFERDIRDGGVSVSVSERGVLFEEVAVYPPAHILNGYLYGVFGLYDYVGLVDDERIAELLQCSLDTIHGMLDKFDLGYWSRYSLLDEHPATPFYHSLHVTMFEALSAYSDCEHCAALAVHWAKYQRSSLCWMIYFFARLFARYRRGLKRLGIRKVFRRVFKGE